MKRKRQNIGIKEHWCPEDMFKPCKKYPNGSSGHIFDIINGVQVTKHYENGKLVSIEEGKWPDTNASATPEESKA